MKCTQCGEVILGDTCMLCGHVMEQSTINDLRSENRLSNDTKQTGRIGENLIDISNSIHIMDENHNTVYDIPFEQAQCKNGMLGLTIKHTGKTIRLKGEDTKAWERAINYQKSKPVWYIHGTDDCEIIYAKTVLGVTPCVISPPFSWVAFKKDSYDILVARDGINGRTIPIKNRTGQYHVKLEGGDPVHRTTPIPEGETLVLNKNRSLVISDIPYLVDNNGRIVLAMQSAYAKTKFMSRGAKITWKEPFLGEITIEIKCDSKLKYSRLEELLPPPQKPDERHKVKVNPYNRGVFKGVDLQVTTSDLQSRLSRFDGFVFEAVCSNLLSAMGWSIIKGYDVRTSEMIGDTRADMGIDIIAEQHYQDGTKQRAIIQCKHWKEQCGGPDVNKTLGAATISGGSCVIMICTGGFSNQAKVIARQSTMDVLLWDWAMIQNGIQEYLLKS